MDVLNKWWDQNKGRAGAGDEEKQGAWNKYVGDWHKQSGGRAEANDEEKYDSWMKYGAGGGVGGWTPK
jgi:hypothetical protein